VLLMLIAIKPITNLLKIDSDIVSYFELGEMELKLGDISDSLSLTRDVIEDKLINEYNLLVEESITRLLSEYGYAISDISVYWNLDADSTAYGSIASISVMLKDKSTGGTVTGINPIKPIEIGGAATAATEPVKEKPEILEIKNKLAGFYNLKGEHINITIQE
ncbi:MAG: stage III sporulation protein AF, partial [Lachnospiraceae bacterium]|nr:stage III sporulation protein AF [Lachnospiraceae bacterium]